MATILLIDGQATARGDDGGASVLASALRVDGFDVRRASTTSEARDLLTDRGVDLVVLDLMIRTEDRTSGLDFARELREKHPEARVLLSSAYSLSERQLERADCGASGFIPKPYEIADVVAFIHGKLASAPSSRRLWHAEPSAVASHEGAAQAALGRSRR